MAVGSDEKWGIAVGTRDCDDTSTVGLLDDAPCGTAGEAAADAAAMVTAVAPVAEVGGGGGGVCCRTLCNSSISLIA